MTRNFLFCACALIWLLNSTGLAVAYYSINNYRGAADNPFYNNSTVGIVYLENFETQFLQPTNNLTTPYVTGWNGAAVGSPKWGVQSDYLSKEGDNEMGWVWSDQVHHEGWQKSPIGIHFDFIPDSMGRLPEYCGAAILGRTDQLNVGGLYNSIFVYDKDGNEVTGGLWKFPKLMLSDPVPEDLSDLFSHFEGIYVPGGISSIQFRDFIEVDHLTYGYAPIPEPGTISLAPVSALLYLHRRRRPAT